MPPDDEPAEWDGPPALEVGAPVLVGVAVDEVLRRVHGKHETK